ncbi:MAG: alpha-2-macroglobulin family protein, partial [Myxococcaceae bacterium]
TRVPVFPFWWGWWYRSLPAASTQTIATGSAELQPDGTFKINFTPEADARRTSKDVSFRYAVNVDVTDEGGETRSAERSFRLGWVAVEARVQLDDAFIVAGEAGEARVTRTNLDGVPRAGTGSYRLLRVEQPAQTLLPADEPLPAPPEKPSFETAGDKLRSRIDPGYSWEATLRSWKDGAEVAKGQLTHDAQGGAKIALKGLAAGVYRIRYETADELGAKFETSQDLIVAGPKLKLSLPGLLLVQRGSVKVGEKARLLVHSGLASQQILFDVFRGGVRKERRALRSGEDASLIELPVAEADRGGFAVGSVVTRDHQELASSLNLFVPWDDKELQVELASFRDKIRPGAKETWKVTVKGAKGQKETAPVELLAYMYDQALELFGPHSPPSVTGLYPSRGDWLWRRSNLGAGQTQWLSHYGWPNVPSEPHVYPARLKFIDAYGLGGPGRRRAGGGLDRMAQAMPMAAAPAMEEGRMGKREEANTRADEADAETKEKALGKLAAEPAAPPPPPAQAPAVQLRSNFSESAFWKPQLLLQPDGSASIAFKVPDSVTAWNVWVHAMTRDLRGGSIKKQTRSVKELMVRPYLPRFLRESDEAVLKVVVNNASEQELKGNLTFELLDPETNQSLAALFKLGNAQRAFTVAAGGSTSLEFPVVAPKEVRTVAVKVVATSGTLSDGELRPVPVLPSRMHLAQSKFVTLRNKDKRTLTFADLAKNDDASRINDQMVVTVDAQLFYSVLQSLPYLVNYPYECTEQTLNRFVSTGIVSSVYKSYPAVAAMAKQMSERKTPLESFDAQDPNRKMTLEESPWLLEAKGGKEPLSGMINVLDPRIAQANRDASLAKLKKSQTSLGAFPWFPGGPPSPYMTLYILYGFAKAAEFGVDVPKDVIQRGWQYLAQHYRSEYARQMSEKDCCWEFLTFLNYVASSYPDDSYTGNALTGGERDAILAHSFKHWKQHSPHLKGYLALTLKRAGRAKDANLVFDSVMDSAKTTQDEGTFWAQEDRSWLWYNDTIETHAFALRTLMELKPSDSRRDGLVQWLLLNKKLNQWKSTRATAEVIYSLVKYLQKEGALGIKEQVRVTLGPKTVEMTFEPDKYTGKKNQIVVPGPEVTPAVSSIQVEKETKGFAFASATWHFSTDKLPTEERGDLFSVSRKYFKREKQAKQTILKPLAEGQTLVAGDEIEVQFSIRAKQQAEYVHLRDPRAAGLEPENAVSRYKYDLGLGWYEETRDSATNFFFEWLPQGEYMLKYRLRVNMAGNFRVGPATLQSMYAPEFTAYSTGAMINVKGK